MGAGGGAATEKFCNLYPHLCFETVFATFNWYKIVPTLKYKRFFLKTGNLMINWLLLSYATCRTERVFSPFDKWRQKGTSKIPIFKHFCELRKIWWCSLGFSKIPLFHHFYELRKTWKYTKRKTNISKSKLLIYGWIGKSYVLI